MRNPAGEESIGKLVFSVRNLHKINVRKNFVAHRLASMKALGEIQLLASLQLK